MLSQPPQESLAPWCAEPGSWLPGEMLALHWAIVVSQQPRPPGMLRSFNVVRAPFAPSWAMRDGVQSSKNGSPSWVVGPTGGERNRTVALPVPYASVDSV